jgi:hypothetical protein
MPINTPAAAILGSAPRPAPVEMIVSANGQSLLKLERAKRRLPNEAPQ